MLQHPNFEKLNAQWHPTENGDLKLSDFSPRSSKIVWWKCDKKTSCGCIHVWESTIAHRTDPDNPRGCPFCAPNTTRVCIHESLAYNYPELIKEWDYIKNGNLDPRKLPVKSHRKVHWKCLIGCPYGCPHEWPARIADRTSNTQATGCPFCCLTPQSICYHQSIEFNYPEEMKQWDHKKNIAIDPSTISKASTILVWWKCPKKCPEGCPHEYQQRVVDKLVKGYGCLHCSQTSTIMCIHLSISYTHPNLIKEMHSTKNEDLDPSKISFGSDIQVWWICSKNPNHEWKTSVSCRTRERCPTGCPLCYNKTESELLDNLIKRFPSFTIIPQKRFNWCFSHDTKKKLPFDFYIVELNLIIELDGEQHFNDVSDWKSAKENQQTDIYKMKLALDHNIRVIRITRLLFVKQKVNLEDVLYRHMLSKDNQYLFICDDIEYRTHKALLRKALKSESN
jgi:hypothetical protein